jgi:uncharacterized protein (TIGR02145 family)
MVKAQLGSLSAEQVDQRSIELSWNTDEAFEYYELHVYGPLELESYQFFSQKNFLIITDLLPGNSYQWRLRGFDGSQWSAFEMGPQVELAPLSFQCGDELIDYRDERSYATGQFGDACWMLENLDHPHHEGIFSFTLDDQGAHDHGDHDHAGYFYCWSGANAISMDFNFIPYLKESTKGVCPAGWHVPSEREWDELIEYSEQAYIALDALDFGINPMGFVCCDGAQMGSSHSFYWSSTQAGPDDEAYAYRFSPDRDKPLKMPFGKHSSLHIRCVEDKNRPEAGLNTGSQDLSSSLTQLNVFPNPATDQIRVLLPSEKENARVQILDLRGKVLKEKSIDKNQVEAKFSLNNLSAGVYIVLLRSNSGNISGRFVKG